MNGVRRLGAVVAVALACVAAAGANGTRTFDGQWEWAANGDGGSLEAVFTPTGEQTWDVAFHFNYRGEHLYSGTAEGSLTEGRLTGEVFNEDRSRRFSFRGSFGKGKFRGTHFETTGGSRRRTGTLALRSSPGQDDASRPVPRGHR